MRTFETYESYAAWRKTSGGASTEPVKLVGCGAMSWPVNYDAQAEIARLTAERDAALAQLAAAFEAAAQKSYDDAGRFDTPDRIRALTPADASAALSRMLDAAYAAGQERMRDRAAGFCDEASKYYISDPENRETVDVVTEQIRALPIDPDAQKALDRMLDEAYAAGQERMRDAAADAALDADSYELAVHGQNKIIERIRALPITPRPDREDRT